MNRIQKIEREIKLSGKTLDFTWFHSQYTKGRLTIGTSPFSADLFEKFRLAIRCVNDIYEGNWDIQIKVSTYGNKLRISVEAIVIRIPEASLTNSQMLSHTVKDLFVKIPIYKSGSELKIKELEGGRMQLTYPEWSSQYFHSHLRRTQVSSTGQPPFYSQFCTGSGHINDFMANINGDGFNEARFTSLLLQIISMVTWESIEGTPYIYISQIFIRSSGNQDRAFNYSQRNVSELKELIISKHKADNLLPDITFELEGYNYTIKDDDKFDSFLTSVNLTEEQKVRFLCRKDESGNYYAYKDHNQRSSSTPPVVRNTYIFRGEELEFKVTEAPEEEADNAVYFVHPRIKEQIKQELEYDTNIKKIRKSTIDRYSS